MRRLLFSLLLLASCSEAVHRQSVEAGDGAQSDSEHDAGRPPDGEHIRDAGPDADSGTDAGAPPEPPPTSRVLLERGTLALETSSRPEFAVLSLLATPEGETVQLQVLRDAGYHHTRRVVRSGGMGFVRSEGPGEVFHDIALHPSGIVTIALEDTRLERDGYFLLRLAADGAELARVRLIAGGLPPEDRDPLLADPPFRLRARPLGALAQGWLRLAAQGEDLVLLFQSLANLASGQPNNDLVSALVWLRARDGQLLEERTRLVDGQFRAEPPLWNYDEFRWSDASMRPLLAVDELGNVFVGRAYTQGRCYAAQRVFGEGTRQICFEQAAPNTESRVLPFFFTMFDGAGARRATHTYAPRHGFYYGVFDMAARGGELALVGTTSDQAEDGSVVLYPPEEGAAADMVPFDGFLALLAGDTGALRFDSRLDRGRGDQLFAVRWLEDGLLVGGATDWDRWSGGMSLSRGADPLLALVSAEDGQLLSRSFPRADKQRHGYVLTVAGMAGRLLAAGLDDAPMTHSGDGGQLAAMSFGGLWIELAAPTTHESAEN